MKADARAVKLSPCQLTVLRMAKRCTEGPSSHKHTRDHHQTSSKDPNVHWSLHTEGCNFLPKDAAVQSEDLFKLSTRSKAVAAFSSQAPVKFATVTE